jgi:hypothetical protein
MTISQLTAKLEDVRKVHGDVDVCFANYLEETIMARVTNLQVLHEQVVLDCEDGGELSQMAEQYEIGGLHCQRLPVEASGDVRRS